MYDNTTVNWKILADLNFGGLLNENNWRIYCGTSSL